MNPNLSYEEKLKMMVSFGAFFVHRILVFVHQISLSVG